MSFLGGIAKALGGGLVSDVAGIFGGKADTHAAKNAITNYTTAGRTAVDQYNDAYNTTTGGYNNALGRVVDYNTPMYNTGLSGMGGANAMLQPGYDFQSSDPSYQWRLKQGLDGVEHSAAASGLMNSGGTLKALNNYAQGAASGEFNNEFTRRNVIAGYAQPAANAMGVAQYNTAQGNAGAANTRAGGITGATFDMVSGVANGDRAKAEGLGSQYGAMGSAVTDVAGMFMGAPSGGFAYNPTSMASNYGVGGAGNPYANANLGGGGFSMSPNTLNTLPRF